MLSTVKTTVPCSHCGLPTAAEQTDAPVFCCHGCRGAYAIIHRLGLESYYDLQSVTGANAVSMPAIAVDAEENAKLDALTAQTERRADGLCEIRLAVNGIHCAACAWLIEKMQPHLPGVLSARVRMSDQSVHVTFDPEQTSLSRIAAPLSKIGYRLAPWEALEERDLQSLSRRKHWFGIALAFFLAANSMWIGIALYAGEATGMTSAHSIFLRYTGTVLGILAAVFPGRVFFATAIQAIKTRTPHVDIPVALAIGVGTIGSVTGTILNTGHIYFDSIASLILLLRIGRYLQFRAQYKTGLSLDRLFRWNTALATKIEEDESTIVIPAGQLRVDDCVLVKAGEMIPADGYIVEGRSSLDCAWLTGESRPTEVDVGAFVVGGTLNLQSPLQLKVSAVGDSSRMGSLQQLIRQAASQKTPLIRLADQVGAWFVIVVLALSLLTFVTWAWLDGFMTAVRHTVSLLTIACPCALALAAPLVITVAIGRAARRRIWIHNGEVLESVAKPGMAWFDKTGTLTYGRLHVLNWSGDLDALELAAAMESRVNHPVASAVTAYADRRFKGKRFNPTGNDLAMEQVVGKGVHGRVLGRHVAVGSIEWMQDQDIQISPNDRKRYLDCAGHGRTPLLVSVDRTTRGVFELGDVLRPEAAGLLRELRRRGWRVGILSGDRQEVVERTAEQLGISGEDRVHCLGRLSPEDKLAIIQESKKRCAGKVMMIGDGINDAAALTVADIGIAVRSHEDVSLRSAPVYIAGDRLMSIIELLDASRSGIRSIYRCFAASLLYNSITITLAVLGWMHPLLAAVLMPISGITVLTMAVSSRTFPKPSDVE